jgi:hypothetical protein
MHSGRSMPSEWINQTSGKDIFFRLDMSESKKREKRKQRGTEQENEAHMLFFRIHSSGNGGEIAPCRSFQLNIRNFSMVDEEGQVRIDFARP